MAMLLCPALCCFLLSFLLIVQGLKTKGSTLNLKEIVLGRCYYYKQFKLSASRASTINCTAIWQSFYDGFAYKDPCQLSFDDYEPYFEAVGGGEIVNKTLFWSGTYKAVHSYSDFDLRFTTLEDTMAGWLLNELTWCGNTTDGIDYQSCPPFSQCGHVTAFWGLASRKFAERARGLIRVMMNGTRLSTDKSPYPAYTNTSFFGKYELPNFKISSSTELHIIVIHTIAKEEIERCGSGSIKLLEDDAKRRNLKVECFDDPSDVKHILCSDYPTSRECLFYTEAPKREPLSVPECGSWKSVGITFIVFTVLLAAILVTVLVLNFCLRKQKPDIASVTSYANHAKI